MAAGTTYDSIASTTVGTSTNLVTFSSISSAYTDLIVICTIKASVDGELFRLNLNNVTTGTGYSNTYMFGDGATTGGGRLTNASRFDFAQNSVSTTMGNSVVIHILNYSNTSTYKPVLAKFGRYNGGPEQHIGSFQSTSAINRLDFRPGGAATFEPGSTFSLYGITAA